MPNAVVNLNASIVVGSESTSLSITWMKPVGGDAISNYTVSVSGQEDIGPVNVDHVPGQASYDTMFSSLNSGTDYFIEVVAVNDAGRGEESTTSQCTSMLDLNAFHD